MDDENNYQQELFESSDPEKEWSPEEELGKEEKKRFRTTKSKKKASNSDSLSGEDQTQ